MKLETLDDYSLDEVRAFGIACSLAGWPAWSGGPFGSAAAHEARREAYESVPEELRGSQRGILDPWLHLRRPA